MKMLGDFLITEFPRENYEIVPVFSRKPININPEDCVFFEGSSNAAIQKSPFFIIQNARITNTAIAMIFFMLTPYNKIEKRGNIGLPRGNQTRQRKFPCLWLPRTR